MGCISSGGIRKRGRIFSNNDLAYRKDLRVKIQYKDQVQDLNTQGYRERGVLLDLEQVPGQVVLALWRIRTEKRAPTELRQKEFMD